jgi:hypothetical protein
MSRTEDETIQKSADCFPFVGWDEHTVYLRGTADANGPMFISQITDG